jgi:collagen type VII alpha
MAISFVGSLIGSHASTSAQTVNFSGLLDASGATPTLQANDIVVVTVFQAAAATRTQAQLTPSGYTVAHASVITASDTNISSQQTSYKVMGPAPDTSVSIPASAATTAGVAYSVHVFRGIDVGTPLDVTATTASGINGAQPNPPSITPATAGAWIYCAAGGAMAAGASPQSTAPTGLSTATNAWRQTVLTTTTNDPGLAAGYKSDWASGAFDCPALTGYTTTNTGSWTAATLALRPQAVTIGNGSSSGSATVSAVGKASAKGAGSASGVATLSGIGKAQARTSGSSSGSSAVGGLGKTGLKGTGASSGSSSAAGVGKAKGTGIGGSSGAVVALGIGAARRLATGISSAAATVIGAGASKARGGGSTAGTAAVSGAGRAASRSVGSSVATAVASGQGRLASVGRGTASGASAVAGQSVDGNAASVGTSVGSALCSGQGRARATGNGTGGSSAAVSGQARVYSTGVGISAGFGVAVGDGQSISQVPVITPSKRRTAGARNPRYASGPPCPDRSATGNLQPRKAGR